MSVKGVSRTLMKLSPVVVSLSSLSEAVIYSSVSHLTGRIPVTGRIPERVMLDFKRVVGLVQNDYYVAFLLKAS
jgi:hypothetical protein